MNSLMYCISTAAFPHLTSSLYLSFSSIYLPLHFLQLIFTSLPLPHNHSIFYFHFSPAAKKSLMGEFDNIYTDADSTPHTVTHTPSSLSSAPVSSSKPYVSTNSANTHPKSNTGRKIVWKFDVQMRRNAGCTYYLMIDGCLSDITFYTLSLSISLSLSL